MMKNERKRVMRSLVSTAILLSPMLANAQNPIISGLFSADPTARVFEGKLYLYPSHDIVAPKEARQDWFCMEDYHVYSSENLVDWTDHGMILSQKQVPWGDPKGYSMWAPDCVYKNGTYYFYYPNKPATGMGFAVGVATASKPYGPFTCDAQPIKGVTGIDPCVLLDDDGKAYIYWQGMGIRGAQLKDNLKEVEGELKEIKMPKREGQTQEMPPMMVAGEEMNGLPEGFKEGPFAFKHNGKYYLTFPWVRKEKGTETLAYAMSDNPLGPWTFKGIIMAEHANGCWTNHHSIVNYKNQWYLFYHHNDYSPKFDKNRSVCADSLTFNADGTIQEVKPTLRGIGINDATQRIQIDRYSSIKGNAESKYIMEFRPMMGWYINLKKDAAVRYAHVDFAKAQQAINIRVQGKGEIIIKIDGKQVAKMPVNAVRWTEEYTATTALSAGVGNIEVIATDGEVQIDWLRFLGKEEKMPEAPKLEDYFANATSASAQPDNDGFIRRWLLLEPIVKPYTSNLAFSYEFLNKEFDDANIAAPLKVFPKNGKKIKLGKETYKWYALDSRRFNVKLFRFSSGINKTMYGVIHWATTEINCEEDIENVRLACGSNGASVWWLNGKKVLTLESDRRMVKDDGASQRLTLKKGRNILRVAVLNGPGMSDMCARFIDDKGNPITKYTIK